jgi:hypothetical protein
MKIIHPSFAGSIGLFFGALFFVLTIWGGVRALASLDIAFRTAVDKAILGPSDEKLNFLLKALTDSPSKAYLIVYSALLPIVSFFGSIVLGALIAILAENPPKNFLLLSEQAGKARELALKERIWTWRYFIGTALASTAAGVSSKFIFALLMSAG